MAEAKIPPTVEGDSVLPLMREEGTEIRDTAISAMGLIPCRGRETDAHTMTITSDEWAVIAVRPDIAGTEDADQLYHLQSDPKQSKNMYHEEKEVAANLYSRMIKFLEEKKVSKEILKLWRKQLNGILQ